MLINVVVEKDFVPTFMENNIPIFYHSFLVLIYSRSYDRQINFPILVNFSISKTHIFFRSMMMISTGWKGGEEKWLRENPKSWSWKK